MSNQVFPTLPGLTWNVVRAPQWATRIQKAVSGKEFRSAWMSAPIYTFRLSYEVLREAASFQEIQQLAVKEAAVGPHRAQPRPFRQQRESFL